jgi:hypothetical protein
MFLSDDESAALEEAQRSPLSSDEDVAALWKRPGIR